MSPKKAINFDKQMMLDKMYIKNKSEGNTKLKLYFAGPWFDDEAKSIMDYAEWLQDQLCGAGLNKYDVYFPRRHNESTPRDTFMSNIDAIDECDAMIALVSSKDVGTAYELGIATSGIGIPVTLLGVDEDTFKSKTNIMLAFCTSNYIGVDQLRSFLMGETVMSYKMTNTWEDKE